MGQTAHDRRLPRGRRIDRQLRASGASGNGHLDRSLVVVEGQLLDHPVGIHPHDEKVAAWREAGDVETTSAFACSRAASGPTGPPSAAPPSAAPPSAAPASLDPGIRGFGIGSAHRTAVRRTTVDEGGRVGRCERVAERSAATRGEEQEEPDPERRDFQDDLRVEPG
jgi:hypothetical protein